MRHARHRRDSNHDEILAALKRITIAIDTHNHADGIGDILARHVRTHQAMFLEVKPSEKAKLTESERAFAAAFPLNWVRVNSIDDALAAVGIDGRR